MTITDGVYGILSATDVKKQIIAVSNEFSSANDLQELKLLVKQLLHSLSVTD